MGAICTAIVIVGISISVHFLASVSGENEKINCNIRHYSVYDLYEEIGHIEHYEEQLRYNNLYDWISKLSCWFTFQCPIGCQCDLVATNVTIRCPGGVSAVAVEYSLAYWTSEDVQFYFWYETGFNTIARDAFKHLESICECYLIISRNNIEVIPARSFEGLPKLCGLFLDNNKIYLFHENAFIGLDNLVYLYLHNNKIADIHPNQFHNLINLSELYLDYNDISEIGLQDFQGLAILEILDIAHNDITEVHPRGFQDLTNLLLLIVGQLRPSIVHKLLKL